MRRMTVEGLFKFTDGLHACTCAHFSESDDACGDPALEISSASNVLGVVSKLSSDT
jgi:hypothetical protein